MVACAGATRERPKVIKMVSTRKVLMNDAGTKRRNGEKAAEEED